MPLSFRCCRLALLLACLVPLAGRAAVLRVPADQPTIQAGIDAAASGDTVEVACGTYLESGLIVHAKEVHLVSEQRTPGCATIDAQFQRNVITFKAATGSLQGFRIQNGSAAAGAGVLIYEGSEVEVADCFITGNRAVTNGGGIHVGGATATLRGTTVVGNESRGSRVWDGGGAMQIRGSSVVTATNCTFADNTGPVPGVYVSIHPGTTTFDRCVFANGGCPVGYITTIRNSCFRDCSPIGSGSFQADPLFCAPGVGDYRLDGASPCLPPGNALGATIGSEPLGCGTSAPVRVVVTTVPPGQKLLVDGATAFSPTGFDWQLYTRHIIEVAETIPLTAGDRLRFDGWSDGGAKGHAVVLESDSLFSAGLARQYALTTVVAGSGAVDPAGGWYDAGTTVAVRAQPDPGGHLEGWQGTGNGSYSGSANPAPVTLNSAVTQRATFAPIAHDFTISASDTNPFELAAPPTRGIRNLYLWATCANAGLSAMGAATVGTLAPIAFVPLNGVLNAGSATDLLLAVPSCPTGTSVHALLGYWLVDDVGGDLCLGPGSSGAPQAVACTAPYIVTAPRIAGFNSVGTAPCAVGTDLCGLPDVPIRRNSTPRDGSASEVSLGPTVLGPNPFSESVRFRAPADQGAALQAAVLDVAGRSIRLLENGDSGGWMSWDGRDAAGKRVPAGIYFIRIQAERGTTTRKVTHLPSR